MTSNHPHFNDIYLNKLLSSIGVGVWDWNLTTDAVIYSPEWAKILGYRCEELPQVVETWEKMVFPEDLDHANKQIQRHFSGETPLYEAEFRMVCRDGSIIWAQDKGYVTEYDEAGKPVRFMGVLQNVSRLKEAEQQRLEEALAALEYNNSHLEDEIAQHTQELVEHDRMLLTVNQVSRKLLTFQPAGNFDNLVKDCLRLLGEAIDQNRVYIWKDRIDERGVRCCTQIYEWVRGATAIQGNPHYEEIPYDMLPTFASAMQGISCLNSLVCDLSDSEISILAPQGIKTLLVAPISVNGERWGFIGVDNCESEELFTPTEESMLFMSGSMLANTIEKMESEASLREMEEYTQMMLDATPLCCNLWNRDFQNVRCNEEAVRLFELSSQEEYLERFFELSPPNQPCGKPSDQLAMECLAAAFETGYLQFEWMHQKVDGTPIPAEITLVRIKDKNGFIVAGYTRDLREQKSMLAELQSKEDDLRAARDEALFNSKAKSNFLANMSHEIRTPMNAISGLTEIMLRESPNRQIFEYAKGIKTASSTLLNLINDILDISKIESGKLALYNAPYELASLLNDAITVSRIRIGDRPLVFLTEIDSRLPARLIGDEQRIKQVLINLLSNAIKFTDEGHIALTVTGEFEDGNAILRFSVRDSGVGIKPEDLEVLFVEFERVNTKKNRDIEGTGLGLPISKQLCRMMDGEIEVNSTYGEGSEFVAVIPQRYENYTPLCQVEEKRKILFYEPREIYRHSITRSIENLGCDCIPCKNLSALQDCIHEDSYDYILTSAPYLRKVKSIASKLAPAIPLAIFANYGEWVEDNSIYTLLFPVNCLLLANLLNGDYEKNAFFQSSVPTSAFTAPSARILVVDDNAVNLSVARGLMAPYGFAIDTATNGLEALSQVQNNHYDLVFMDHMMPVMDGIDTTIAIRKLEAPYYTALPIIALTANALVENRDLFLREGMNDFLAKPIEPHKLSYILAKWLPASKIIKNSSPQASAEKKAEGPKLEIEGINTAQGILSIGGSEANYKQILATYYTDALQKCTSLPQHFIKKDLSAFRTEVHGLKSASATIGAQSLAELAAKLELAAQKSDDAFIENNLDLFLDNLKKALKNIQNALPDTPQERKNPNSHSEPLEGNANAKLNEILAKLYDAANQANIRKMETLMQELQDSGYPEALQQEMDAVQKDMEMFEYDNVIEHVIEMQRIYSRL